MLARAHLSVVHLDFSIFRLLHKDSTGPPPPELLEVSAKMLEGVMIVILIRALQNGIRDPSRGLPPTISKASLVRNLCVLASQLESLACSQQPTYTFCTQAAKSISREIDQILEEQLASQETAVQSNDPELASSSTEQSSDGATLLPEDATVGITDSDSLDFQDLGNELGSRFRLGQQRFGMGYFLTASRDALCRPAPLASLMDHPHRGREHSTRFCVPAPLL